MTSTITFQNMNPFINHYNYRKELTVPGAVANSNIESINQDLVSFREKVAEIQSVPDREPKLDELKPIQTNDSIFPAFLSDPVARGLEKMSMVIYDKNGKTIGAVGESGIATMSTRITGLYYSAEGDMSKFTEVLEKMGLTVKNYSKGDGPSYAEFYEKMFEMRYIMMG